MNIGIIGLGKMGRAIAHRVLTNGDVVYGFDINKKAKDEAHNIGVQLVDQIIQLPHKTNIIWLMLPAGELVDKTIKELLPHLEPEAIIIDGGNSNFKDSMRRAAYVATHKIHFLDCGTSGGLRGEEIGFSLMVGGEQHAYQQAIPLFKTIAMKHGYGLVGPSGAGHYVKMVHNGIEYALLQSYAEGFELIKDGHYQKEKLDLAQISNIWQHGSIIRSYLLELSHHVLVSDSSDAKASSFVKTSADTSADPAYAKASADKPQLTHISGAIDEGGTGRWAFEEAREHKIATPALEQALEVRAKSRTTGGTFATKLIALLRHAFGGHEVKYEK